MLIKQIINRLTVIILPVIFSLILLLFLYGSFAFAGNKFLLCLLFFPLILPFLMIALHDKLSQNQVLRQSLSPKTPYAIIILIIISLFLGDLLPTFIFSIVEPQQYADLGLGGLIYFILPIFYYYWLVSLWYYLGLNRATIKWLFLGSFLIPAIYYTLLFFLPFFSFSFWLYLIVLLFLIFVFYKLLF